MSKGYLPESLKSDNPIINFFCDLIATKPPPWKTASTTDRLIYLTKYYSAILFFTLTKSYHSFISWITQYYPFSLLYRNRLIHHDNLTVRNFMMKMEKVVRKAGVKIFILGGKREEYMTEFTGYLDRETKNRTDAITILETTLQEKYQSIYVRDEDENVRILIPTEVFDELINQR
jgi:hypothetical protein